MENIIGVLSIGELAEYIEYCEEKAVREVVNKYVKPKDARLARQILRNFDDDDCCEEPQPRHLRRKNRVKEVVVRKVTKSSPDYSNIKQFLIREK